MAICSRAEMMAANWWQQSARCSAKDAQGQSMIMLARIAGYIIGFARGSKDQRDCQPISTQ
jgi:hypothetical protein